MALVEDPVKPSITNLKALTEGHMEHRAKYHHRLNRNMVDHKEVVEMLKVQ